ncbi:nitrate reductase molybdenum cofactor assembly chaperone [Paenibacillus selenitireducens]|uniref:Nitrate reductase molybdenum cofactor assembly chaperone n=1 Tax=Paenibacillus selenitireducens TaxID=1324314 RepID=A0A1T2X8J0_9BACL|nr:nitrate reductase molybdenum cofactor assembly chaperone [Paenibacillus selenitireducens]OPA76162.1 nitrate reductase molybdenum cofactor assembly chaperone [Paenibacillus selenitireducens]
MINLEKLYEYKHVFGFMAQQLTYPEKLDFHPSVIDSLLQPSEPAFEHIQQFWNVMHEYSMEQLEELYVQTFDFQKDSTLYMTYFKFEDSKERGQMLAKLKILYQMFGLDMPDHELSDYLPLMCEFIYAADWQGYPQAEKDFGVLVSVIEDGTFHLLQSLEKSNSPYYHLIKALRETLKVCIRQEASNHEHA